MPARVEPGGPPPAVEARGLAKRFGDSIAVDGVDLVVADGEAVALLGPNGAGKTTTLLMILGVTTPDAGEVRIMGHRMPQERGAALAATGFAAGYLTLPDRLRVREGLRVFADFYGVANPRRRVGEVLELFGIEGLARSMTSQLSSGQRTLVGLAKAMLPNPRLLVLDEPTASLDPDVGLRTREALIRIREEQRLSVLVTSHNMSEVEMLADRVVFLYRGRVAADAAPGELASLFGVEDLEEVFLEIAAGASAPGAALPEASRKAAQAAQEETS